jgi:glyoxylate reductase
MRVHVTRRIQQAVLDRLGAQTELTVGPGEPPARAALLEAVRGCDGVLTLITERVDAELLKAAPRLRVVSNMAVGVDNIDVAACTARKIPVGHTPGVLTEATADQAFALLLAAARRVVEGDAYVRSGAWKTWHPAFMLGKELSGATLAIFGFGKIGQAVARRARAFGLKVLPYRRGDDKRALLAQADFVSVHLPLKPDTRHFLGAEDFAAMREGSVLVNTARGGVLDQAALAHALRRGRPAFAALDVMDPEPPRADDPLLRLPNVVLAPHLGSATVQTRLAMANLAADNLLAALRGERPPHVVNPEAL